jgi:signal transduction histidine kinase
VRFGKELGVDDYLIKPFNADDFLVTVKSKLKRNQEIRQQAENRLDDARRAMVQLLSHELRTPLTYVTGGFSLLADGLEQDKLPSDMQLSMGLIKSGTERLNHLAEQLVMYAELVSGHSKIQLEKLGEAQDFEGVVNFAIKKLERESTARSIRIDVTSRLPYPVRIYTVAELIGHAIYEVTRNAIAFSGEGGSVQVDLTLNDKEMAIITISDQGRGIPQEDQERIWEIMIQSERTKHEQQGAGMGLPIVKQIMLLHGGNAQLQSETRVGTTVTLSVPIYREEA